MGNNSSNDKLRFTSLNSKTKHPTQSYVFNSHLTMAEAMAEAEALPQFKDIEEINAEDSSSKLEEFLCTSLDQGSKVKSSTIFLFLLKIKL